MIDITAFSDVAVLVGIALGYFFVFRLFSGSVKVHEFDDFGFVNLIMSFSMAVTDYACYLGIMPESAFFETNINVGAFYAAVFYFGKTLNVRGYVFNNSKKYRDLFYSYPNIIFFWQFLFVIFLLSALFFSYLQVVTGLSPEDRIVFAKNFRIVDIFRTGSANILLPLAALHFVIFKSRKSLFLIVAFALISSMNGSKSFVLIIGSAFFVARGLYRGYSSFVSDIKSAAIVAIPVSASVIFVIFFYTGDFDEAVYGLVRRVFYAGDVFLYAYIFTDYHNLFDLYDPITYLLHPFLRLFGFQGYELPVGAALASNAFGLTNGTGPNANLSVVALVLMRGDVWLSAIFCACGGALVAGTKYASSRILLQERLPAIWRLVASLVLFPSAWLLIDIGTWEQVFITVGLVFGLTTFIFEFLGGNYFKNAKENS
ncbi:MAG: hypothetical protein JWO51_3996 [Rhodospirillales bacterium]|nr:hypothetical protein [Rhodospirillales bacterium]